jgi:hypothetical protein
VTGEAADVLKPVTTGFQPRFISMAGRASTALSGNLTFGGPTSGFCRVDSTTSWVPHCIGVEVYRNTDTRFFQNFRHYNGSSGNSGTFGFALFSDSIPATFLSLILTVQVDSVSTTGFTLRITRGTFLGVLPSSYSLNLSLAVLG